MFSYNPFRVSSADAKEINLWVQPPSEALVMISALFNSLLFRMVSTVETVPDPGANSRIQRVSFNAGCSSSTLLFNTQ